VSLGRGEHLVTSTRVAVGHRGPTRTSVPALDPCTTLSPDWGVTASTPVFSFFALGPPAGKTTRHMPSAGASGRCSRNKREHRTGYIAQTTATTYPQTPPSGTSHADSYSRYDTWTQGHKPMGNRNPANSANNPLLFAPHISIHATDMHKHKAIPPVVADAGGEALALPGAGRGVAELCAVVAPLLTPDPRGATPADDPVTRRAAAPTKSFPLPAPAPSTTTTPPAPGAVAGAGVGLAEGPAVGTGSVPAAGRFLVTVLLGPPLAEDGAAVPAPEPAAHPRRGGGATHG
jgi:hypothetical protein